jgi:two-component system, NtrC family, sensor kinase
MERASIARSESYKDAGRNRFATLRRIEAILEGSTDWVWETDAMFRFTWLSSGIERSVGVAPANLIGRSRFELAADAMDRDKLADLEAEMRERKPFEGFVYRLRRPDGGVRHVEIGGVPVLGLDGTFQGYAGLGKDVTEREKAEHRVQIAQRRMTDAVESLTEGFALFDPSARFVMSNKAFVSLAASIGAKAGFGKRIEDIVAPLGPTAAAARARCWSRPDAKAASFEAALEDGRTLSVVERRTREGGIVAIWTDVSEIREAERTRALLETELRQSQKLDSLGTLAGGIAHEINTPTQYVGDNLRFLKGAFADLAEAVSASRRGETAPDVDFLLSETPLAIDQSLDGIDRVRQIVAAVKEFSYPDAKEKAPADLHAAINTTLTVSRNQWKYVADVETRFAPDLPHVPCHVGEINQVVLNLVVNAAHAIEAKGEGRGLITVSTKRDGEFVEIVFADTGTGVPREIADRVFDPFFTTKPPGKGTGQGLAISRAIVVKKHGGAMTLRSTPGAGAEFTIRLPLGAASAAPATPEKPK